MAKVKRKNVQTRHLSASMTAAYTKQRLSPRQVDVCSFCGGDARDIIQEMPSPVGHVLAGIAVGSAAGRDRGWWLPLVCGLAAGLPDVDFLLPVAHRGPTHSLIAALTVFAVTLTVVAARKANVQPVRVAAAIALAVLSHVLLDWLGEDSSNPRGVMALWPFAADYYISELDVFDAVDRRYWRDGFWRHNLIAVTKEIGILLPFVVLARAATLSRKRKERASQYR